MDLERCLSEEELNSTADAMEKVRRKRGSTGSFREDIWSTEYASG